MPDSVMFRVQEVTVELTPFDLPGPTRRKVTCSQCGQMVRDHREVERDGQILCKPCAGGAYFTQAREISFPDMNWSPYISKRPANPESLSGPAKTEGGAMRKTR
jgi:formylmethanofuran dehydrogenase subunit E